MNLRTRQLRTAWILTSSLASAWLGMMIIHELGHVLFAWITGASVERIHVPLVGISWTQLSTNPNPVTVAWGGFIVGGLVPAGTWLIAVLLRSGFEPGTRFFASFCLLANGAYMASAMGYPVGDVEDIIVFGGARWPLIVLGPLTMGAGLLVLGRAGPRGLLRETHRAGGHGTAAATGALIAAVIASIGLSSL